MGARTAPSNVYVYFPSRLDVALAVYEPWLKSQVQALARGLMLVFDGVALRRNLSIATVGPDLVDTMVRPILAQARRSGELGRAESSPRTASPCADRWDETGSASSSQGGGGTARRRTRRQLFET
jgi:AcrR family transcriptional regulator